MEWNGSGQDPLEILVSHHSMMHGGKVFREIIGKVVFAWHPIKMELALVDAVFHPVKTHVKSLGLLSAHVACEDAMGGSIVCLDWSWWLLVAQFG